MGEALADKCGGQFCERIDGDFGSGERLPRLFGGGQTDAEHTGGIGGGDSGGGVFDDGAGVRGHIEAQGSGEEHFGIGFSAADIATGDDGVEEMASAEFLEDQGGIFGWSGGAEGKLEAIGMQGVDELCGAGHGGEVVADDLAIGCLSAFVEGGDLGIRIGAMGPEFGHEFAAGSSEDGGKPIRIEIEPLVVGHGSPGFQMRVKGIDEDPVHVKNDCDLHKG